jgi:hypothetical protein
MSKAKGAHVSFADVNSEKSESFESSWGGRRDYGAIAKQADQSSHHHHHVKHTRRVTIFGNKPSLTIDFGLFAFSSSQRDIIWYSFYCFLYISLAVVAFSFLFEKWSIVDSIYFATTTFTTTGFGDKVSSLISIVGSVCELRADFLLLRYASLHQSSGAINRCGSAFHYRLCPIWDNYARNLCWHCWVCRRQSTIQGNQKVKGRVETKRASSNVSSTCRIHAAASG